MRTRWLATTALLLLLLPAAAVAEQFDYGVRSQLSWRDNVYGTPDDLPGQEPIDDWSVGVSPWGRLSDADGDLTWSLRYQPTYEYYLHEPDLRNIDQDASADLTWRIGDRTTLTFTEAYQDYDSVVRFNEGTGTPTDPATLRVGQTAIIGNFSNLTLRRSLTPRDFLTLNANYGIRKYDDEFTTDRDGLVVGANYTHDLDERTTIGASGSWTRQSFARNVGDDSVTDYYNLSGILEHRLSRPLRFELSGGPTLIDSNDELVNFVPRFGVRTFRTTTVAVDADTCPVLNDTLPYDGTPGSPTYNPRVTRFGFADCGLDSNRALSPGELQLLGYPRGSALSPSGPVVKPPKATEFGDPYEIDANGMLSPLDDSGFGDSEVTYFARAALIGDWENWHAQLAYQRAADESGSFGVGSVRDSLEMRLTWEPVRLWSIGLSGAYTMVDQVSEFSVPTGQVVENKDVPAGVDSVDQIATVQSLIATVDDDAISYTTLSAQVTARRQLTRRSSAFAAIYWYQQEQELDTNSRLSFVPGESGGGSGTSTWNTLTFRVGLEWYFDTFTF